MTSFLAKLDYRGTLSLDGPDGRSFLQGQTTCNLDELDADHSLAGAYCNPQGRMVCDFRLLQQSGEQILLVLEADAVETALATFGKYILFSKAEISDVSDAFCHYALWGDGAAGLAGAPSEEGITCWRNGSVTWTASDVPGAFEACVPAAEADAFEAAMAADTASATAFRQLEIEAGIGHVAGAGSGLFLPQMLNFQLTGRVSFNKGCYTGQEVVARMHYRGKVKRPMVRARVIADGALPGDPLFRRDSDKTVGNVVLAAAGDGELSLLASVASDAVAEGVTLGENGPELEFLSLPYPIESG